MCQVRWVDRCLVAWGAWARDGGGLGLGLESGEYHSEDADVVPLMDDAAMEGERAIAGLEDLLRKAVRVKYKERLINEMAVRRVHRTAGVRTYKRWVDRSHEELAGKLGGLRWLFDYEAPGPADGVISAIYSRN